MSKLLDKSFTVSARQIWRWTRRGMYVVVPIYFVIAFLHAWDLRHGGVILRTSPFKDRVPEVCVKYADGRSSMTPPGRTAIDSLLLRDRVMRWDINSLLNGTNLMPQCAGYAVLMGMHARSAGEANFTDQWVDANGDPVVTITVTYQKTLNDIKGISE